MTEQQVDDEIRRKGKADFDGIRELMDTVIGGFPIWAVRIGYRADSTEKEKRLADWMFDVSRAWENVREEVYGDA